MVPGAGLPAVVCMILSFDTHVQPSGPELQLLLVVLALLVVLVLPDEFGVAGGIGVGVASDVGAACGDVGVAVAGIGGVYDGSVAGEATGVAGAASPASVCCCWCRLPCAHLEMHKTTTQTNS